MQRRRQLACCTEKEGHPEDPSLGDPAPRRRLLLYRRGRPRGSIVLRDPAPLRKPILGDIHFGSAVAATRSPPQRPNERNERNERTKTCATQSLPSSTMGRILNSRPPGQSAASACSASATKRGAREGRNSLRDGVLGRHAQPSHQCILGDLGARWRPRGASSVTSPGLCNPSPRRIFFCTHLNQT